jgi:hypothetical protein
MAKSIRPLLSKCISGPRSLLRFLGRRGAAIGPQLNVVGCWADTKGGYDIGWWLLLGRFLGCLDVVALLGLRARGPTPFVSKKIVGALRPRHNR